MPLSKEEQELEERRYKLYVTIDKLIVGVCAVGLFVVGYLFLHDLGLL